jgi:hypothetical protein
MHDGGSHLMSEMAKRRTDGIPPEALGKSAAAAVGVKPSEMSQRRVRVARGELRVLAGYGEVWIQVLGSAAIEDIEAATFRSLEGKGLQYSIVHQGTWNLHRFRRVLADAVRHPERHDEPFGTLADWGEEPDDMIAQAIVLYQDVKSKLDPTCQPELTEQQAADITEAFKKKDFTTLKSFGAVSLASWLITGAVRPYNSATPASKSGDSLPESSATS